VAVDVEWMMMMMMMILGSEIAGLIVKSADEETCWGVYTTTRKYEPQVPETQAIRIGGTALHTAHTREAS
jgi:hypothetical protein